MNQIEWTKRARKELKRINKSDQFKVVNAVDGLADLKTCQNVKALTNHRYDYRLRVGNYRVLFDLYETIEIVKIEKVSKRDERTYN